MSVLVGVACECLVEVTCECLVGWLGVSVCREWLVSGGSGL